MNTREAYYVYLELINQAPKNFIARLYLIDFVYDAVLGDTPEDTIIELIDSFDEACNNSIDTIIDACESYLSFLQYNEYMIDHFLNGKQVTVFNPVPDIIDRWVDSTNDF